MTRRVPSPSAKAAKIAVVSRRSLAALAGAATLVRLVGGRARAEPPAAIRVGHFPNITHVQALVARALSRQGKGWFEQRLGRPIEWFAYNAGPSAMEAIFAESIDLTYVGPSPAINAYAKSRGEEIRIVAGALDGGSALVVRPDEALRTAADFRGKRIGTPQLGNTQDVAARTWLAAGGLKITIMGGDAQVIPTANPDQLGLFRTKQLDGVWTVEPWVSRLELEADGKVLVDQRDAVTTVLVSRAKFLASQRALVRDFVRAHDELTAWVRANPEEAQKMVRDELSAEMRSEVSSKLVAHAWGRIVPTSEIAPEALVHFVADARQAGFLRTAPDLSRLVQRP